MNLPSPTTETPLLAWLIEAMKPMSRTRVKDCLRDGRISVNGVPITQFDHPLRPGDRVTVSQSAIRRAVGANIAIVFEDDTLIVIDKPPGLLTVATEGEKTDTAFARLSAHLESRRAGRPFVVHRLDRETSGLLLFARTELARDRLQGSWSNVTKTYLAIVEGMPKPPQGVIENYLVETPTLRVRACQPEEKDAKRAVTRYCVNENCGGLSLVEVGLVTGRKHQIRAHLAGIGCPVIGDEMYGAKTDPVGRLGLHAWRLAFEHPVTNQRIEFESPLPNRLRQVMG